MFKKKFAFLLIGLILFVIPTAYAGQNNLQWGMSSDNVQLTMGNESIHDYNGKWSYIFYENQGFSKYNSDLTLWFADNQLYMKKYRIFDEAQNRNNYDYISNMITQQYGYPEISSQYETSKLYQYCEVITENWMPESPLPDREKWINVWFLGDAGVDVMLWKTADSYIVLLFTDVYVGNYVDICFIDKMYYE